MSNQTSEPEPLSTPAAVLSLREACRYLHLGEREVRRLCVAGELEAFTTRGGGAWRIPLRSCDDYIEQQVAAHRRSRAEPLEGHAPP